MDKYELTIVELIAAVTVVTLLITLTLALGGERILKTSDADVVYKTFQELVVAQDAYKLATGGYEQTSVSTLCPKYTKLVELCGKNGNGNTLKPFGSNLELKDTSPVKSFRIDPRSGYGVIYDECPPHTCAAVAARVNEMPNVTTVYVPSERILYFVYDDGKYKTEFQSEY